MPAVDRAGLLSRLVAVSPGLTATDTVLQSSCFCFSKGWVYTFNTEIACAISSGLDPTFTGAVSSQQLLKYLKSLDVAELEADYDLETLAFKGKGRWMRVPVQPEILLPVRRVERAEVWQPLHKDFSQAVVLVSKCARKRVEDRDGFGKVCVHVCPNWVEAGDGVRLARYTLPTFVQTQSLVRASTLREIGNVGFFEGAETPNWLHFRTKGGFRMSIRRWESDSYPDNDRYLKLRGRRVKLPQGLRGATQESGVFAEAGEAGPAVLVSYDGKTVTVEGKSVFGEAGKVLSLPEEIPGGPFSFKVSAALLRDLADQAGVIEVNENLLRYDSGSYTYLTSLESL